MKGLSPNTRLGLSFAGAGRACTWSRRRKIYDPCIAKVSWRKRCVAFGSYPDLPRPVAMGLKCAAKLTIDPKRRQCTGLQTYAVPLLYVGLVPRLHAPQICRASSLAAL
jgi:hypothetical protein